MAVVVVAPAIENLRGQRRLAVRLRIEDVGRLTVADVAALGGTHSFGAPP